jgi:RNA polymerase sigma factor (sigma-70 family)
MSSPIAMTMSTPRSATEWSDAAVLRAELEAHHAESFGWAMSCCGRKREDAENVLQLVYLKVLSGKAVYGGGSSFRTWLFAVIRKTAANERRLEVLRSLRLRRVPKPADVQPELLDDDARLTEALGVLASRQREVLHLVFYHDLSIAEAAKVMGVGVGTARTHYERGKQQLRRRLG